MASVSHILTHEHIYFISDFDIGFVVVIHVGTTIGERAQDSMTRLAL